MSESYWAREPGRDEVSRIGESLGFGLTDDEVGLFHTRLLSQIRAIQPLFDVPEAAALLPAVSEAPGPRRPWSFAGGRPNSGNPDNVFITHCRVEPVQSGILDGLTVGLKDNIALADVPMTLGSPLLAGYRPEFDATVVTRLLRSGATIVGKMGTFEFSIGPDTSARFGAVLNPRDHTRATGGSSAGSAAAVLNGSVDLALGGDQGGSIRFPASWCGVVGMKPTFGLIPHTGIVGADPTVDYVGPMARSVQAVALALQCLAGPDGLDPRQPSQGTDVADYAPGFGGNLKGVRIGVLKEGMPSGTQPGVRVQVLAAAEVLSTSGADVVDVSVPEHRLGAHAWLVLALEGMYYLWSTGMGGAFSRTWYPESLIAYLGNVARGSANQLPLNLRQNVLAGRYLHETHHGSLYARAQNATRYLRDLYDQAFLGCDVILMPTTITVAPTVKAPQSRAEAIDQTVFGADDDPLIDIICNLAVFNCTGHPAMSVPFGAANGLPVGVQLVGRWFDEGALLRVGHILESHRPGSG
jgi:amidase